MNLKDRLKTPKQENIYVKKKDDSQISDIFESNKSVEIIVSECVLCGRNFIITGNIDCDKSLVETYIKKFDTDKQNIKYCGKGIKGLISVFENVLAGKTSNISYFDLKLYDELLKNIKLLMSVNIPNLKEEKFDDILKTINPVFIHVAKNEDGLFCIENIAELQNQENKLLLKGIYPVEVEQKEQIKPDEAEVEPQVSEEVQTESEPEPEPEPVETKKVNKYKLLREKFHRKNSQ